MKMKDIRFGMFVQIDDHEDDYIPAVGWVVGLTLPYGIKAMAGHIGSEKSIGILPLVQFVGEDFPRGVNPGNLSPLKD